jgi:hypothetical protein
LIIEKEIKQENNKEDERSKSTKRRKSQSNYINQFTTHIWPSIFAIVKKHDDLIGVFHYLKTLCRKLGEVSGLYEN